MKIYTHSDINNLNLYNLKNLEKYLIKTNSVKDIYSNSGIYKIENNSKLSQVIIYDGDIITYENYIKNKPIYVDKSIIKKIDLNPKHISNEYVSIDYCQYYYSFQKNSPLYLVVELLNDNKLKDIYFRFENTYAAYSDADINNPFIKEDIDKFLNYF